MYRQVTGWFGTVDNFIEPLIEYLGTEDNKAKLPCNGRVRGWLYKAYGYDNIQNFIQVCKKFGFNSVIIEIYTKHIKTKNTFNKYLGQII